MDRKNGPDLHHNKTPAAALSAIFLFLHLRSKEINYLVELNSGGWDWNLFCKES